MPFVKGQGGKPKGAVSSLKRKVREVAKNTGIDPYEVLLLFSAGNWQALGYSDETYTSNINEHGIIKKYTIDPSVRCKAAAEACQYIIPKLRSIEYTKADALGNMTPEQKLEAMKQAVLLLELQVKQKDGQGTP